MSISAASHLSPSYPERAAWGTAEKLRAWQADALQTYLEQAPRDFLAVATPGAGKTTFALRVATELLARSEIERVTVVTPTEHLRTQWADAAAKVGITIDPRFSNAHGRHGRDFQGVAVTYAAVASKPQLHRARTQAARTLVILDEVHHGGDARSWGEAIREAFDPATRRLALTGTPFRSDTAAIPFVRYELDEGGLLRSRADYTYGYGDGLRDGVVRPVLFLAYGGGMRWRTRAGDELSARLGEPGTRDVRGQAWRTALQPQGEWIPAVLRAADFRLTEVRKHVPDAGGLVIATDQATARAYADQLETISGEAVTVVLSDDAGASARIEQFAADQSRWMVAVRMVSEGVDVPRLCVGVYATSTSTPLFFAQAVGRLVRARRRGETASVFLPRVPVILEHAGSMEQERDHVLDRPRSGEQSEEEWTAQELPDATEGVGGQDGLGGAAYEALESDAQFDHVLFDAQQFGLGALPGSEDEQDYLGLPGLLEPDQVAHVLRERQRKQARSGGGEAAAAQVAAHRALATQRRELNQLVAGHARKSGQPHAIIHAELRRQCGGPDLATADAEQVQQRIDRVRQWLVGRR
jgi:superfamily II DNA or RNA helicase